MKKILISLAILATLTTNYPVQAQVMGFLKSEKINGNIKYCYYSNGVILTIYSYELCKLTT